ncbi:cation:proton antiporter [Halobaculum sp. D14]|uniref:cation:proton antiporter n=1 Tax=Halobaculum sp. D14 TaxID=3421642 RepID=UPI003EBA9E15
MGLAFGFVTALLLVYGTSYALGFLERFDVPVLVAEILAGILFGSVLGVVGPGMHGYHFLVSLASFGLLLIMFEAGVELDTEPLRQRPRQVAVLGLLTFVLPFLGGAGFALAMGLGHFAGFLVGVTVSTTSLGLVYPLLEDFGYISTDRGQLILAVAVLNDILSVVALAYGITLTSETPVVGSVAVSVALAAFLVVIPRYLVGPLKRALPDSLGASPTKVGVLFAVAVAWLMEAVGVHAVLGGFFAGFLIGELTDERHAVEAEMRPVVSLVAPVFFFFVGMRANVPPLTDVDAVLLLAAVVALGVGLKVVGAAVGGALTGTDRRTTALLAAAVPGRLSISVAAAEIGRRRGLIADPLYDAFIVLSVVSVFVAAVAFRFVARDHHPESGANAAAQ